MIGQTLAHYRVAAAIGAGGMGEVYGALGETDAAFDLIRGVVGAAQAARLTSMTTGVDAGIMVE